MKWKTLRRLAWACPALLVLSFAATNQANAALMAAGLGPTPQPPVLGGYTMTPFGPDVRPLFSVVSDVPSPLGGSVTFSPTVEHLKVGMGWATWNPFYSGDVYWTLGATSLTLGMPAATGAFYFYAEPNPFAPFVITATAQDGTSVSQVVSGFAGASGFGFFGTDGSTIVSITVSSSVDFAVGEFGIASGIAAIPEPATLTLSGIGLLGLLGCGWRFRRQATPRATA